MDLKNLGDLKNLIENKIKESLTLEYKSELGENDEIAKDISAFANTLGGTIIYGIHEDDGIPTSFSFIKSNGIKERIESVILSHAQPKIEGCKITPIEDPNDSSMAIFVVEIPESLNAPHMVNHRYYKRYNFASVPMDDHDVKDSIFKKGLRRGLEFEISQNLNLAKNTYELIEKIKSYRPGIVKRQVFTPFYTDAWKAAVSSGILSVFKEKALELVNAYRLIHEINHLIDCQKHGLEIIVTPLAPDCLPDHGKWIPALIQDRLNILQPILEKISLPA